MHTPDFETVIFVLSGCEQLKEILAEFWKLPTPSDEEQAEPKIETESIPETT